jgi:catecholate siderophore receptor
VGLPSERTARLPGVRSSSRRALTAAAFAGVAGLALAPGLAFADETTPAATGSAANTVATADDQASSVEGVEVTGARRIQADSPKYVAPLVDTPQTITVVPKAVIEAQNLLTLRDILSTVPGITFGAGEGGSGYGDSINLRGYSASSDITVDGVRDSAQYSRSDPFNLQQLEVVNGANSVFAGAGSLGGSINLVSKTPEAKNENLVQAGVGTDNYYRATVDLNRLLTDNIAVRLNAMGHENDAPGRDVEDYRRWGVAPSITFGLTGPTQLTLSYFHQTDNNIPQYGVPFIFSPYMRANFPAYVLPGVDNSNYYGYANIDRQQSGVDLYTAKFDHTFSDNWSFHDLARGQSVVQLSVVDAPQGTFCLPNGINPQTGVACAPANTFAPSGPRGTYRHTLNTLLYNESDLSGKFNTGQLQHSLTVGVALTRETYHLNNGNMERNADGSSTGIAQAPGAPGAVVSITNPSANYTGPINFIQGGGGAPSATATTAASGGQVGSRDNEAAYLFDDIKVTDWFSVNGGVRYEHNEGSNTTSYYTYAGYLPATDGGIGFGPKSAGAPGGVFSGKGAPADNSDDLVSYRVGLVFKPSANSSIYLAYGNTETPSQSSVNGACVATTASNTCDVAPEKGQNLELGGKWDTMDGKLSLTASVFRNQRTNYKIANPDPTLPDQTLDGQSRVTGVALGASGKITDKWSIFTNYTYLDSLVVRGVPQACLQAVIPTASQAGCATAAATDATGKPLTATPKNSGSIWTTYNLVRHLQVGYGLTYSGDYVAVNAVGRGNPVYSVPGYVIHKAMISYEFNHDMSLQLNVNNLFDKSYYNRVRTSTAGWATPGDTRNATLTLNYRF